MIFAKMEFPRFVARGNPLHISLSAHGIFFPCWIAKDFLLYQPAGYRDRGPIGIPPLISIIIIRLVLDKALHNFHPFHFHTWEPGNPLHVAFFISFFLFFFSGASRWTKHKSHHKRHGTWEYTWHYFFYVHRTLLALEFKIGPSRQLCLSLKLLNPKNH